MWWPYSIKYSRPLPASVRVNFQFQSEGRLGYYRRKIFFTEWSRYTHSLCNIEDKLYILKLMVLSDFLASCLRPPLLYARFDARQELDVTESFQNSQ